MGQVADQILSERFLFNFTFSTILQLIDHTIEGLFEPSDLIRATNDRFGGKSVIIALSRAGFQS
ncbi:hypothetical protein D3C73_1543530 [compost metagenome]